MDDKPDEMIGRRFGRLVVLSYEGLSKDHRKLYRCACDCGQHKIVCGSNLRSGETQSCGCFQRDQVRRHAAINRRNPDPIIGHRFGRLIVLTYEGVSGESHLKTYKCICDCGKFCVVSGSHIKHGQVQSCGCLQLENQREGRITHGMSATRTYKIWKHMRQRCNNQHAKDYRYYGGRGIEICSRWKRFENFLEDMGEAPENMSIDRIDNDGNYEPRNCRWATQKQQTNNASNNRIITFQGRSQTLSQWADELGIRSGTLRMRLSACGWPVERAFATPVQGKRS